jgi:hypothetical protein
LTPAGQSYFQRLEVAAPDEKGNRATMLTKSSGQYAKTHARWYGALYKQWTSADEAWTQNRMETAAEDTVTYYTMDAFTMDNATGELLLLNPNDYIDFLEDRCGFRAVLPDAAVMVTG